MAVMVATAVCSTAFRMSSTHFPISHARAPAQTLHWACIAFAIRWVARVLAAEIQRWSRQTIPDFRKYFCGWYAFD